MATPAYILIDAATGSAVPLPFYTRDVFNRAVSIHDVAEPCAERPEGRCKGYVNELPLPVLLVPGTCGLQLITEAEYMRRQA